VSAISTAHGTPAAGARPVSPRATARSMYLPEPNAARRGLVARLEEKPRSYDDLAGQ
jgi:hypothetical protein